ncbi:WD40 repeat domain-containing protein [Dactylosporangium sp. NBC_01737]|uniref:WD40 repeat domain-containing protein n=1 Tax=Dactylosporangium sp. NBC_01737 TaxID=2975959 RepID=UPI002E15477F|nr:WD40 repeat domain-containing protein [Dactylosporangium sp. NBC_01737]
MSEAAFGRPNADPWVARIHDTEHDGAPIGSGVVIDESRVLTSRHVVQGRRAAFSVSFPKASTAPTTRRMVREVRAAADADVAVLVLEDGVPPGVTPAPLRSPSARDLSDQPWWAFGFPTNARYGSEASGDIGGPLAYGWVSLHTRSHDVITEGFSGAGLWSPTFKAVVGIVGEARIGRDHPGDGLAMTLQEVDRALPGERLSALTAWRLPDAGEPALAAWGWSLDDDDEAVRHWRPRARGVSVDREAGFRFSGRTNALTEIVRWLRRPVPDRSVLIVTGSPGVGKSAVLGRIVTTADASIRAALPERDTNVKAPLGSVSCAIHAKGKTALDVAAELARAASIRPPREVEDLVPALRDALEHRPGKRFNVVIDALDEATTPAQVRLIASGLLVPVVETCADVGAQIVVGTRRNDDGGDLLAVFGRAGRHVNLDDPEYFAEEDLAEYALSTLRLVGDERPGSPYADPAVALPVARRIAALAKQNFLIAGLVARTHGLHDVDPVDPALLEFPPTVDAALDGYLQRLAPVGVVSAKLVLTALAYAQGLGFSVEVWSEVLRSLSAFVGPAHLEQFSRSAAANFLVETSNEEGTPRFRLFHQALNDSLLRAREERQVRGVGEEVLTRGLIAYGRRRQWAGVDPYLLTALPVHADRTGLLDELLVDDRYLLHADLLRLISMADHARSPAAKARARLLQLTPRATSAGAAERAALFSVTQTMERLGRPMVPPRQAPYGAVWAATTRRTERAALEGHSSRVNALCSVRIDGQLLLASASDDWTVRLWDPVTGMQEAVLRGHTREVRALSTLTVSNRQLLVTAADDETVIVWDPATGRKRHQLTVQPSATALCEVHAGSHTELAIGLASGEVLRWNPAADVVSSDRSHGAAIVGLCAVRRREATLREVFEGPSDLVSVAADGTMMPDGYVTVESAHRHNIVAVHTDAGADFTRLRTPEYVVVVRRDGTLDVSSVRLRTARVRTIRQVRLGQQKEIAATSLFVVNGRPLLAAAGEDGSLHLWDALTGEHIRALTERGGAVAVTAVDVNQRQYLASAGEDLLIRVWDPTSWSEEQVLDDQTVRALALVPESGEEPVVAGLTTRSVTLWSIASGRQERALTGSRVFSGLCAFHVGRAPLLASSSRHDASVQIWNLGTGRVERPLPGLNTAPNAMAALLVHGRPVIATANSDGAIRLWDVARRRLLDAGMLRGGRTARLLGHAGRVTRLTTVRIDGQDWLLSAGEDQSLRLWDPQDGSQQGYVRLPHPHQVTALCAVTIGGHILAATGGRDHSIELWDPFTGLHSGTLAGHSETVRSICVVRASGQDLLASASNDRTLRLWDLRLNASVLTIPIYHQAMALVSHGNVLIVGVTAGIVALRLEL